MGSWQTWLLGTAIVLWGAMQYGLVYYTLRDLLRRPRVRGDNKVVWALVILTLPLVGALLYASIGPTSFLPRGARLPAARPAADVPAHTPGDPPPSRAPEA